jgi:hypothetical protein
MSWMHSVLVVANVTATSTELVDALKERAAAESATFSLMIPAVGGRAAADARLGEALAHLREHGLEVDGSVGDPDPLVAVTEAWDPKAMTRSSCRPCRRTSPSGLAPGSRTGSRS